MSNIAAVIVKENEATNHQVATNPNLSLSSMIDSESIISSIDLDSLFRMFERTTDREFYITASGGGGGGGNVSGGSTKCCATGTCDDDFIP
jgi:hypothetical protein